MNEDEDDDKNVSLGVQAADGYVQRDDALLKTLHFLPTSARKRQQAAGIIQVSQVMSFFARQPAIAKQKTPGLQQYSTVYMRPFIKTQG